MRRRIAVFANGWGNECLLEIGHGMQKVATVNDTDIFVFVNFAAHDAPEQDQLGEFNVFTIPDLDDFDGVVVLANSFNTKFEFDYVTEEINKRNIPAISVEGKLPGMDYFGIDDYQGMRELTEHLIKEHNIKNILYMGGIEGHEGDTIRQKAVLETALENGITVPEENILHGSFAAEGAIKSLTQWRKSHTLPEVVICANDIMAIGVCNYFKEEGLNIPEDIKVTGFDCLKVAGKYEPSITSVTRDWVTMGKKIMEKLLSKIDGEEVPTEDILGSRMIIGGSCGCELDEAAKNTWKTLREKNKKRDIDGFQVDQHFRHMFLAMRSVSSIEYMSNTLSWYFEHENWYEGNNIMVGLCPDFFVYGEENPDKKITMGYPAEMDAACFISNGKKVEHHRSKTSALIFEAANRNQNAGVYFFAPIKSDNEMYGFVMTSDNFDIIRNDIFYIWTRHMGQYLEMVKSNVAISNLTRQLEALSVTDKLTDVYNRAGCETVIYAKLTECQGKGGRSVVLLADLDRLKKINDMFGHSSGDLAIKTTINLLKERLPSEYMIGRYGGDEFLIAAPLYEEIDVDALALDLMNFVTKNPITKEFSFSLSLSVGGIQLDKDKKFNIQDVLPIIDKKMYAEKDAHHMLDK